jgi:hypothetical protein
MEQGDPGGKHQAGLGHCAISTLTQERHIGPRQIIAPDDETRADIGRVCTAISSTAVIHRFLSGGYAHGHPE